MPDQDLYPLLFEPQLRHYVWGGRNLETLYGRRLPPGPTAESWEISGHAEAPTKVANGAYQGLSLPELVRLLGPRLLGTRTVELLGGARFPLLVKLLDAHRDLSVQVHPDDAYAREHEHGEQGKTEAWYILAAEEGARLVYGLRPGTDSEAMKKALAEGTVVDLLTYLPVKAGDCVYVPTGTVHAVMSGTVVAEIQQTSDVTYRIYDFDRLDKHGKPRKLHNDLAIDAIDYSWQKGYKKQYERQKNTPVELVSCPWFTTNLLELNQTVGKDFSQYDTFVIYMGIVGKVRLVWKGGEEIIDKGETVLVPAILEEFKLEPLHGEARLLEIYMDER